MHISANFDGGNIEVVDATSPSNVRLKIRKDHGAEHYQWFNFRVTGARDIALQLRLENAGGASYPPGWKDYRAVASYDREHWFRVPASYADGVLTIEHTPEFDAVQYAYFAPYTMHMHHDLVAVCQTSPRCRLEVLGQTLDGQDLELLTIGSAGEGRLPCWVIARQHPGETMAEWLMEGLLARLLDDEDPIARALLSKAVFYAVPNMNPDGSRRGHLRTNACGANLNREWQAPSMERSPEVFLVRERMRETGVAFCLDVHGDEALPYNFIAGPAGVRSVSDERRAAQAAYEEALEVASPDFQRVHGYPEAPLGEANMTMATNWIADAFGALAMTLEQPFKDTKDTPHELGWSPERCRKLGHANLDALWRVLPKLR